jgi:hypothetical protein
LNLELFAPRDYGGRLNGESNGHHAGPAISPRTVCENLGPEGNEKAEADNNNGYGGPRCPTFHLTHARRPSETVAGSNCDQQILEVVGSDFGRRESKRRQKAVASRECVSNNRHAIVGRSIKCKYAVELDMVF